MRKELLKKIIPNPVWAFCRRVSILNDHKRISLLCDKYIDTYFSNKNRLFDVVPKKNLEGKKIIWQYWAQGYEGKLPEVVKVCFDSVDKYKGEYEIIRLSDATIAEYVDIPDFVWQKRGHGFSVTAFSNVLRLALLDLYGGVWLDATVLLTDKIPESFSQYDFFMFQRDENEPHKKYWENTYAYYFGWGKRFKVRVLTSIVFSKKGSRFIDDYLNLLLYVWKANDEYPFYFTFQILFNQLVESGKSANNCPIFNDCLPHYLMQIINDGFKYATVQTTCTHCSMHKLTFKDINIKEFRRVMDLLSQDF